MRPQSVIWFSRAYLAALLFGIARSFTAQAAAQVAQGQPLSLSPVSLSWLVDWLGYELAAGLLLQLALWWLIARRGNGLARWLFLALTALAVLALPADLAKYDGTALVQALILAETGLRLAASAALLRTRRSWWLYRRRAVVVAG